MKTFTIVFLVFWSSSFGQPHNYQNLLDSAVNKKSVLFVFAKPLQLKLDPQEISHYVENVKEFSKQNLDTFMFKQIIKNSKNQDTTFWKDNELTNSLLVKNRNEVVPSKYALQKFALADKRQKRFYKKQIDKFNFSEPVDRDISYFSRPIFDNSKTFAAIQWDNGHSYLGGGGGIILYQLQNDKTWKVFGIVLNWRY